MQPASPPIVICEDDDDDNRREDAPTSLGADCFICYEPYSEHDKHRPAAMRCGHVAGESCLRKWLESSRFCPSCRKSAKARDLTPLYNLPTRMVSAGNGAAASAASAPPPDPGELAQKEMLLQKVQRAYNEKEKEAQQQAQVAKRRAQEAEAKDREVKRLRLELENAKQQLQQQKHVQAALALSVAGGWGDRFGMGPALTQHQQLGGGGGGGAHGSGGRGPGIAAAAGLFTLPPPTAVLTPLVTDPNHRIVTLGNVAPAHTHPFAQPLSSQLMPMNAAQPSRHVTQSVGRGNGTVMGISGNPGMAQAPGGGAMWGYFATPEVTAAATGFNHSAMDTPRQGFHLDGTRGMPYSSAPQPALGPAAAAAVTRAGSWEGGGPGAVGGGFLPCSLTGRTFFEPLCSFPVEGCRLLALDTRGARLLVSEMRRGGGAAAGGALRSSIRKISMHAPESYTRIRLPANAGIMYDMQFPAVAAAGPRFLGVVTQGAGLCLACSHSDSVVATFTGLPHKPWCCSWLPPAAGRDGSGGGSNSSGPYGEHMLVAGLAQGHVALLDTRRTDRPVAVLAALQHQAARGCAQMPIRTIAALSCGLEGAGQAAAFAGGAALWPICALSCAKGAWMMSGSCGTAGDGGRTDGESPVLLCLDGGQGGGSSGMQLESLFVHRADWDWRGPSEAVGKFRSWRTILSWRPTDTSGIGGAAAGPRHEVGLLGANQQTPYKHEVTVTGYTRRGIHAVRSCLVPLPPTSPAQHQHTYAGQTHHSARDNAGEELASGPSEDVLLVSSDDDTRQPVVWSLRNSSAGPCSQFVQRLERHPEPLSYMVAASIGGAGADGDWYLACGSQARVSVYRRGFGYPTRVP